MNTGRDTDCLHLHLHGSHWWNTSTVVLQALILEGQAKLLKRKLFKN